jgi:hypothetical protein
MDKYEEFLRSLIETLQRDRDRLDGKLDAAQNALDVYLGIRDAPRPLAAFGYGPND